jgi:ferredoxin/flavodoxin---NADP+ reductase
MADTGTVVPRRIAVIGAGPSGLFAAQALAAQDDIPVTVDVFDRMPTPYGLLRYGVAPDHGSIKTVADTLARVFDDPLITFQGMVELGRHVSREEFRAGYDAVVYAIGVDEDMRMNVPGEDLPGSGSARAFVEWYSGHPDAQDQDLTGVTSVATIGLGNVAVDVARLLVKEPDDLLYTDMPDRVLDELHRHTVSDVWIVGRRGPQHASYTTKELRELIDVPGVLVTVSAGAFHGIDLTALDRRCRANVEALMAAAERQVPETHCRLHFLFWRRPLRVEGVDHVERLVLEHTRLEEGRVVGTGETTTIPVQRILRSIGYRGTPLPGLPFDASGSIIPNIEGRVRENDGRACPGEYVVGWIKRGPTGVIGTNKSDAHQTVGHMLEDLAAASPTTPAPGIADLLASRGIRPVTFEDWERIDDEEKARGATHGRSRTKVATWSELRSIATGEQEAHETATPEPQEPSIP